MRIRNHSINNIKIVEINEEGILIQNAGDALDMLGSFYYNGFDGIIIGLSNITPQFFDLKTGLAGEILQKFSNYKVKLAITGDFSSFTAKSIRDFIYESNKRGQIIFVSSAEDALNKMS